MHSISRGFSHSVGGNSPHRVLTCTDSLPRRLSLVFTTTLVVCLNSLAVRSARCICGTQGLDRRFGPGCIAVRDGVRAAHVHLVYLPLSHAFLAVLEMASSRSTSTSTSTDPNLSLYRAPSALTRYARVRFPPLTPRVDKQHQRRCTRRPCVPATRRCLHLLRYA